MKNDPQSYVEVVARDCCRYIEGDAKDGSAIYCGDSRDGASFYCSAHRGLCTVKRPPKPIDLDIPLERWRPFRASESAHRQRAVRGRSW